jgi:RNA polymerase sigma-70 factor (ECF subfamily)
MEPSPEEVVVRGLSGRTAVVPAGSIPLAEIAAHYGPVLQSYFRRRVDPPHECEDLTQEVLLRLAARRDAGDIRALQAYLFQTAGSVLTDHYRRRAARGGGRTEAYCEEAHAPADLSPEQAMLGREKMERLRQSIAALPDRARQAFVLFRFEGMRQAEIAARMGISVSAVEKLIKRGMIGVAAALADED